MNNAIAAFLAQQQVLTGMIGAALVGGVLFGLRQLPGRVLVLLREAASVTLVVDSDEAPYRHLSVWLARHRKAKVARRVRLTESYDYEAGEWRWEITLGGGWHALVHRRSLLLIHRFVQDPEALGKALGAARHERIQLISFGRSQELIRSILSEAKRAFYGDDRVSVFCWCDGGFLLADKLHLRDFSTVFLPEAQKMRLTRDVEAFLSSREVYRRRGTPWRRGYLFEGPPGTGKTTLIHVLGSLTRRSVYVINLNSIASDSELLRATNEVGPEGVLVIEDIDSAQITHDRDVVAQAAAPAALLAPGQSPRNGPSLSGLLNAIDGVTAREGRILAITSNRAEKLDAALVRPGRVDVRMVIAPLQRTEAWAMFKAFRPDGAQSAFDALTDGLLPIPASALQNLLLTERQDEARVVVPMGAEPPPQAA